MIGITEKEYSDDDLEEKLDEALKKMKKNQMYSVLLETKLTP